HIDGDKALYQKMESIKQTAIKMGKALAKNRFDIAGQLLNEEWDNRKKRSKNVTTPKIEKIIKAAFQKGATAAKVCGAGGGGVWYYLYHRLKKRWWKKQYHYTNVKSCLSKLLRMDSLGRKPR
ncbi:MAG: hypothetical protein V3U15_02665, partial [Nitrospinota bacterium]